MIVLGGLVAAPVLAVGGLILRQQGRKALATAQADALEAEKAIAEMRLAEESTRGITERAEQLTSVLQRLRERALEHVAVFEFVLEEQDDYLLFSDRERAQLASTVALVKTARAVIDVPVIDADGNLTPESAEAVVASQAVTTTHAGSA
ncbi:MAG TPA: hypothetical protein VM307_09805, partial [Egibacteraceae bacterium]|nr:hypothetical protein [Egibacteraceae bacterium]